MRRRATRLAWTLLVGSLALKVLAVALVSGMPAADRPPDGIAFLIWTPGVVAFALVGALIASRHPTNAVGWIFLAVGFVEPLFTFAEQYARIGLLVAPGSLPGAAVVGVAGATLSSGVLVTILLTGLLFPTGHLPSQRWRPVLALVLGWLAALVVSAVAAAGPISETLDHPNPLAVPGPLGVLAAEVRAGVDSFGAFLVLLTAPALVLRWRGSEGAERAQLAWLVYAIAVLVAAVTIILPIWELELLGPISPALDVAFSALLVAAVAGVPVSAGMAILRHRLYDIDVVVRRTLVYTLVVAVLGVVYVGLVLALQAVLAAATGGGPLPVALSTLAIAALFGPVRRRVRDGVDRRFYRSRYDAQQTMEQFGLRIRDEVELDSVGRTLVETAAQAIRPASAGLWVRSRRS